MSHLRLVSLLTAGVALVGALVTARSADAQCVGNAPNGTVSPTESCDDNNNVNGDGCSMTCTIEPGWSCGHAFNFNNLNIRNFRVNDGAWTVGGPTFGTQTVNTDSPTLAIFGEDAQRGTYVARVRVDDDDDDWFGFGLGFEPGDEAGNGADWVLIDWKQALQDGAPPGVRVAHVKGAPNTGDSTLHDFGQRRCPNPNTSCVRQLAVGRRLGTTGWTAATDYTVRLEYTPTSLRYWIDGRLELDLEPTDFANEFTGNTFPAGQLAFYGLSQLGVRYTNLTPFGASPCNLTALADATINRPLGGGATTQAVAALFMDVGDMLDVGSITILSVAGAATAVVNAGNIVVTPANDAVPGVYTITFLACDNDPIIPDCDEATITVRYANDGDGDGVNDGADLDDDNDGIPDRAENPYGVDPDGDADNDGVINALDKNDRGDGMPGACVDGNNNGVCDALGVDFDRDGDGVANHVDLDADGDGLLDVVELGSGVPDANRNGIIDCPSGFGTNGLCDVIETAADSGVTDYNLDGAGPDAAVDTDGDGLRDFLDLDSDGDGLYDLTEGESGCVDTTPRNGRCDGADTDRDGVVNSIDGRVGPGVNQFAIPPDSDGDGAFDFRELDADADSLGDLLEGAAGCADVAAPPGRCDGPDANGDGIADDANATIPNTDGDAQPDYQDIDADNDGIRDAAEGAGDPDGDGRGNWRDLDADGDGISDLYEGASGCADAPPRNGRCDGPDADGNGLADDATNPTPPDTDGDGAPDFLDLDADNDGGTDLVESGNGCRDTTPANGVCDLGDGAGDGWANDAATTVPRNTDLDPTPDHLDLDSDQDGRLDLTELASGCADNNQNGVCDGPDADMDGIADSIDTAPSWGDPTPTVPPNSDGGGNPDYRDLDSNGNGMPDVAISGCADTTPVDMRCDGPDTDGDGAVDPIDGFNGHGVRADTDGDGVGDRDDLDDDNDGIPDTVEMGVDTDGDGVPDDLDLDSDDDGLPDVAEAGHDGVDGNGDGQVDCAGGFGANGLCDALETAPDSGMIDYTVADTDDDGVDDFRDLDSDDDGITDVGENGTTCTDDPANGVCDGPDRDRDGIPDSADHTSGFGGGGYPPPPDTDDDGTPDFQDLDSDGDGIFDLDEAGHGATDADDDGQVDGGDEDDDGIRDGVDDSDLDGTPDATDPDPSVFGGGSPGLDTDGDGTPDQRDDDADGDGVSDEDEAGPTPVDPLDTDGDGTPDFQDVDSDGDAQTDGSDNCRIVVNPDQVDTDGDGVGDLCDSDVNGDGFDDDLGLSGGGCATGGGGGGLATAGLLALATLALAGRRRRRAALAALTVAGLGLAAAPARAQLSTEYSIERFRMTGHRDGILDVEWGDVAGHLDVDVGLWLGYEDDPLNVYRAMDGGGRERVGSVIDDRIGSDLVAALDLWHRLQLGVALPLIISQSQDLGTGVMAPTELSGFGIGDVKLMPKLALIKQRGASPFSLGLIVGVTLPTANTADFGGESSATVSPELALSRAFGSGLRLGVDVGYHSRKPVEALDLMVDDELFVRAGLGYDFAKGGGAPVEVDATFAMATAADDPFGAFNRNAAEAKLGVAVDPTRMLRLFAAGGVGVAEGFGTPDWRALIGMRLRPAPAAEAQPKPVDQDPDRDGILGAADACPTVAENFNGIADTDGCPEADVVDTDGDGLADPADSCPIEPEDKDGFADTDGCPDLDNDGDTVLDVADQCRDQPGTVANDGCPEPDSDGDGMIDRIDACPHEAGTVALQGCPDRDGDTVADNVDNCPDEPGTVKNQGCKEKQLVKIIDGKLEILDIVYFKLDKAIIEKRSYKLLDNVATVLSSHPNIKRVRVEGHTDSQGKDAYNKDLSQRRAEAVKTYLVNQGLDEGRLEAVGFGEEKPIADNRTKKGRATNRRVEFIIVGDGEGIDQQNSGPGTDTLEK